MAGQPQEPPWSPQGPSQPPPPAADQVRWQGYDPPGAAPQGYGHAQQEGPAPGYGPVYEQQPPYGQTTAYDMQDTAYDQTPPFRGQDGAQDQAQGRPGWQQPPRSHNQARSAEHAKGFLGALFDFGFTSFVTPKIIKVLYGLVTVWTVIWALIFLRLGFHYGGVAGGIATLVIVDPVLILVSLGIFRVVLEFFMVIFRMQEDVKAIRDRGGDRG